MGTRTRARTLTAVAALGLTCLAPMPASAASTSEDPTTSTLTRSYVPDKFNARGHATFDSYGERLFACDDFADGKTIQASLEWNGEHYMVEDENGFGGGCQEADVPNIPEGDVVYFHACVDGSCTAYKEAYA